MKNLMQSLLKMNEDIDENRNNIDENGRQDNEEFMKKMDENSRKVNKKMDKLQENRREHKKEIIDIIGN